MNESENEFDHSKVKLKLHKLSTERDWILEARLHSWEIKMAAQVSVFSIELSIESSIDSLILMFE